MRRFRAVLALVAVVLLVPAALLVRSALRSVELEREVRHQVVADRIFDEMERSLSSFLEREEERPFGHYAPLAAPVGANAPARSPLAEAPGLPFVLAHFQVDPDGRVSSPRWPAGEGEPLPAAGLAAIGEVERAAEAFWRRGAAERKRDAVATVQSPGTTVELKKGKGGFGPEPLAGDEREADDTVSAYDALRSLNKGVEQRARRQGKVSEEYVPGLSSGAGPVSPSEGDPDSVAGARANEGAWRAPDAGSRFELSPMTGERVAPDRLLLARTAVHEGRLYRQGLLLDLEELGRWLRGEVLDSEALGGRATVRFVSPDAAMSDPAAEFVYQHRFAFPFEDLNARLTLAPLPGTGGPGTVYALSLLLLVATGAGLFAIDRMVAVALRYAEQRSNFVAAVTHELKTPLTAIRMYGEMLRDGMVASAAKRDEYHRHITGESERLTRLVNNVLELARLEKSARRSTADPGSLDPVVTEAAALARPHAEREGFVLHVDVEPDLPPVRFERDALLQVLFNLVDNAVKYANGASPKEIALAARRDGDAVLLTVRDRGPGVPSRHLGRIFEPFYRGSDELTRRTKGTGIGLALVRGLVEEMGARVSGRNLPEGGFEVTIAFPGVSRV